VQRSAKARPKPPSSCRWRRGAVPQVRRQPCWLEFTAQTCTRCLP
jgi:hypothetical protein